MKCPKCNTEEYMKVNPHMLVINKGPEGPLHEVRCEKCLWVMTTKDLPKEV